MLALYRYDHPHYLWILLLVNLPIAKMHLQPQINIVTLSVIHRHGAEQGIS